MNWYYVEAGQQAGPVDDAQLEELQRSGKIQPETLVWHEGMTNWQPCQEARPAGLRMAAAGTATAVASAEAACAECGGTFPIQDMVPYGTIRVCARCKPIFMQKLSEGAQLNTGTMNYAGFWIRFGAVFLDGILLWVVNVAISMVAGLGFTQAIGAQQNTRLGLQLVLVAIQLAIGLSYEVIMIGKFGATLGKMACKIQVVTAEGGKVSYLRALGRYFAKIPSSMICLIGFIMAGFDEQKRALHDRICSTRVVLK